MGMGYLSSYKTIKEESYMKKKLSILLILALLLTSLPLNSAVASSNSGNDIVIGTNDLDNMILVDTDTITIQDD